MFYRKIRGKTYGNDSNCPCKKIKCSRHGNCQLCLEHHHEDLKNSLTCCERIRQEEDEKKDKTLKRKAS